MGKAKTDDTFAPQFKVEEAVRLIKRILSLAGIKQYQVGQALGIDRSSVSNYLTAGKRKRPPLKEITRAVIKLTLDSESEKVQKAVAELRTCLSSQHQEELGEALQNDQFFPLELEAKDLLSLILECEDGCSTLITCHRDFPISRLPKFLVVERIDSAIVSSPWEHEEDVVEHLRQRFLQFDEEYRQHISQRSLFQTTFMRHCDFWRLVGPPRDPEALTHYKPERMIGFLDYLLREELIHRDFGLLFFDHSSLAEKHQNEIRRLDWLLLGDNVSLERTRMVEVGSHRNQVEWSQDAALLSILKGHVTHDISHSGMKSTLEAYKTRLGQVIEKQKRN